MNIWFYIWLAQAIYTVGLIAKLIPVMGDGKGGPAANIIGILFAILWPIGMGTEEYVPEKIRLGIAMSYMAEPTDLRRVEL